SRARRNLLPCFSRRPKTCRREKSPHRFCHCRTLSTVALVHVPHLGGNTPCIPVCVARLSSCLGNGEAEYSTDYSAGRYARFSLADEIRTDLLSRIVVH